MNNISKLEKHTLLFYDKQQQYIQQTFNISDNIAIMRNKTHTLHRHQGILYYEQRLSHYIARTEIDQTCFIIKTYLQ